MSSYPVAAVARVRVLVVGDVMLDCPFKAKLGCQKQYKSRASVRGHVVQSHREEPDYRDWVIAVIIDISASKTGISIRPSSECDPKFRPTSY